VTAFPSQAHLWTVALAAIAVCSLVIGNLAALVQKGVKRMLAYSSISQAGFMLIAVSADSNLGARAPRFESAETAISMKPACEIDEYASIRFTPFCTSAARLPITSEQTAIAASATVQRCAWLGNAVTSTRSVTTSAAALVAAAMNAVTGVGAPS